MPEGNVTLIDPDREIVTTGTPGLAAPMSSSAQSRIATRDRISPASSRYTGR
jgi:hypothetical protein